MGMAIVVAGGCATVDARSDLEAVRALVEERSQSEVAWSAEESARATADARVGELLGGDLTTEKAVQVAFLRNRTLQTLLAEVGIAQAEWVQAGRAPNPVLSADMRFGLDASGTGADLGVVQEFLSVLQLPLRKRVAQAELEATKLGIGSALFELATQVRAAFFEAQGAEQMLELRQRVSESVALAADVSRRQHEAGNITDLERANQEALVQEAKLALAEAELAAVEQREALTALLGLWGGETRWQVGRRLPGLPQEELAREGLESVAVERRLDLAAARQRVVAAASSPGLRRLWGFLPEAGGVASEREVEGGLWSMGPSLEFAVPLFDQRQAERAVAQARRRQSEADFARMAVQIRSDVRRGWARLEAARNRALYYERVALPLRADIVEQTQREYNGMLVGVYELLQAKRHQIEAGGAYVEALRDYWVARVELERALGTELPPAGGAPAPASVSIAPVQPAPDHRHDH